MPSADSQESDWQEPYKEKFVALINDDLNMPGALAAVHELITEANRREQLEQLSSEELHDRAIKVARHRADVRFFWRLLESLPAAEASAGCCRPSTRASFWPPRPVSRPNCCSRS